ncbi:polysaccharide deacetylase family protein [Shewanella schlegeliana]|uniref:Polysaccharide deacetylase family protein n=1 Tax=Shewanella schlegeliana TaxID=190308 RepID=A0ABS1T4L8_9GAMM|nr:polysaccharide deacetylase family protein [Shewanella schlegeliana]MBL4914792.1 polysaccharide deacetylase family protein [Shewanella schlegeliana]MCL1111820.1 polysaccharide deacetylase family protein [Shewanella schlegeliana]GIU38772.1 polysaccharide deacetylase [Shewanella schlegeliana]
MVKNVLLALLALTGFSAHATVILQYHHVSDSTPAITSVTPAQFKEQMQYLAENNFNVVPLSTVVESIKAKKALPAKTIAITFDDGYRSIANTAHPILKQYKFPYTLFVSVEPILKEYGEMMSWQQLITLSEEGAEIANHSWGHEHLIRKLTGETDAQWLARIESNILRTENEIAKATGQNLKMLAYPYGEYNQQIEDMLEKHGFVAFGQQSGAAGPYSPLTALPRFPVAGVYADLNSLKVKLHSLNMPVLAQTNSNPELAQGQWRPEIKVTLDMSDINASQLMCFIQGQGAKKPNWISDNEFSIQAELDLPAGRSRYNCTAPSKSKGSYYWFSQPWVRPKSNGQWIAE